MLTNKGNRTNFISVNGTQFEFLNAKTTILKCKMTLERKLSLRKREEVEVFEKTGDCINVKIHSSPSHTIFSDCNSKSCGKGPENILKYLSQ